jgi:uncharacterized protein (TIGR02099 family)
LTLILRHTLRFLLFLGLGGLFCLALVISAVRFWLLPHIDQFRPLLESRLSQSLKQPVRIRHLQASLQGLTLKLGLQGVAIGPADGKSLEFEEIQLGINPLANLKTRQLKAAWGKIAGARMEIYRQDGRFRLVGLSSRGGAGVLPWLLEGQFELKHSTLLWYLDPSLPPITWHEVYLRLRKQGAKHRLLLRFKAPEELAEQATLNAELQGDLTLPQTWQADFVLELNRAKLKGISRLVSSAPSLPAGQGNLVLRGKGGKDGLEGTLNFEFKRLSWHTPWLAQPLKLAQVSGQLYGRLRQNGWQIEALPLYLANSDLEIHSRFKLSLPAQGTPHLDLLADLSRFNLEALDAYLPRRSPPGLAEFLSRKPLHGLASGRFAWRGKINDFPFRDFSEASEVQLQSPSLKVQFHPQWPTVEALAVKLNFQNGLLTLTAEQGKFDEVQIKALQATLNSHAPEQSFNLQAQSRTQVEPVLQALARSPLRPAIAKLSEEMQLAGELDLSLGIALPLLQPKAFQIDGQAELRRGSLSLKRQALALEELQGKLRFSRTRLTADLNGRLRQQPAHLEASVDQDKTLLSLRTRLDAEVSRALSRYFSGTAQTLLTFEASHTGNAPRLTLLSDLQGLSVHLPYPLGKTADQIRPLRLSAVLEPAKLPLHLDYGPLHAALAFDRTTQNFSGQISLGDAMEGQAGEGLTLTGRLDRLPLEDWLKLSATSGQGGIFDRLSQLDLYTEQLHFGSHSLGPHHLKATASDLGWQGTLASPYLAGAWFWKRGLKELKLELEFIDLDKLKALVPNAEQGAKQALPLQSLPTLLLNARQLKWQNRNVGGLQLKALPDSADQMHLELALTSPWHRLEASGRWELNPPSTHLSGHFASKDLGALLAELALSRALVQTPTRIDFKLHWQAAPYRFSVAKLNGHAQIEMGPGRWLDVEPGASRLLGLLHLGTLGRRLRLDFSDLFQAGLAYEHIGGQIRVKNGLALTDDLTIAAPSARIHIAGTVDLVNRQVDEYVTVSPNTPVTLELFKGQTGLSKMVGLAQSFFNAPLDSITQSQYAIYGTVDNPKIVLVRRSLPGNMLYKIWSQLTSFPYE